MNKQHEIKKSFLRMENALNRKPSIGLNSYSSKTRINGLSCSIQENSWNLKVDMPMEVGGQSSAPSPGVLGRAALGSCLAIGYMLWASRMNVEFSNLEVEVQADSDDAGLFGTAQTAAGYSEVRYCVKVESLASEEDIIAVLDAGDSHSPWLDILTRPVSCIRKVEITATA